MKLEPNLMLQVLYRLNSFDRVFISREWAKDRIFSVVESTHPDELVQVKENLLEWYEVSDKNSMLEAIRGYDDEYMHVFMALLHSAYESIGERITELDFEKFNAQFMSDSALQEAASVFLLNLDTDGIAKFRENLNMCAQYHFGELVYEDGEKSKNLIPKICDFFAKMAPFYTLAPRSGLAGFDYARIVQIVSQSFAVGYISAQECEQILNTYGDGVRRIFTGWDEYLASFLLGSAYLKMLQNEGELDYIGMISERISAINIALNSPFDMFKESGIWSENLDEAREKIGKILAKFLDLNAEQEAQKEINELVAQMEQTAVDAGFSLDAYRKALDIYMTCVHGALKAKRVDTLEAMVDDTYWFIPLHHLGDEYAFYGVVCEFLEKTKTKLEAGEYPIMTIFTSNLTLFTNRGIYIYSGMMFLKKVKFYAWKDANFRATISSLGALRCFVDNKEYFDIELAQYEKLVGKNSNAEEDERVAMFKDEIDAISEALNALKEHFGR